MLAELTAPSRRPSRPRLVEGAGRVTRGYTWLAQGRVALGICAGLLAGFLPWLGLHLRSSLTAWDLPLTIPHLGLLSHASYGLIVTAIAVIAGAGAFRTSGRPNGATRACGWALIVIGVCFFVASRGTNGSLQFVMRSDNAQWLNISHHFGYSINAPPATVFGLNLGSTTALVFNSLRPGWLLTLVAGVLLAGRFPRPRTRFALVLMTTAGLALVVVAAGIGTGLLAQRDKLDGINAEATGSPAQAIGDLNRALRLDPSLRYDRDLELTLGEAQSDNGAQSAPLAEYARALRTPGANGVQQIALMQAALSQTPGNPVIADDYASFLVAATLSSHSPNEIAAARDRAGSPAVAYALGRYYYSVGDVAPVISYMHSSITETTNLDVRSSALTYIALAELRQGDERGFRRDLLAAVRDDPAGANRYARAISAGLYQTVNP